MASDKWPLDAQGEPMAKVSFRMEEKIGLPNYSNVTYDGGVERFVVDTPEQIELGFQKCAQQVEDMARTQREIVLQVVKRQTA